MPLNPTPGFQYSGDKDLGYVKALDLERYHFEQGRHKVRFFQQGVSLNSGDSGAFYGEHGPRGALTFAAPVEMPVHVKLNPDQKLLNRYGFDHPQDAIIVFSLKVLETLGINPKDILKGPKIGDRVDFYIRDSFQMQFELREVREWDFWGNSKAPLHLVCVAQKMTEATVV